MKKFSYFRLTPASFRYYIDESFQNIKGCEPIGCQNRRLSFRESPRRLWICPCRLYDKTDAEDLAGEIVCEILASAESLKSQDAFGGFAWKIAESTFRKFIRKKQLLNALCDMPEEKDIGFFQPSPEEVITEKESDEDELYRLRQELSLLTKRYREVTVSYYVHGKRCHEIASEQNISVEMVKYHLFKTRKLLKVRIGMTRKLGEKSYNPGVFRMDFWGDRNIMPTSSTASCPAPSSLPPMTFR